MDVLIRDVPDEVIAVIDSNAARLGLSRSEYLRRRLVQAATPSTRGVDVQDLTWFADTFADLADPSVIDKAWK